MPPVEIVYERLRRIAVEDPREARKAFLQLFDSGGSALEQFLGQVSSTADGRLRLCLLRDDEADLLTPLRRGATYDEITEIFRTAAYRRPFGHALAEKMFPQARVMIQIGG